jgi:rare lipoprotein A
MRSSLFVLASVLAVLGGVRAALAQTTRPRLAPISEFSSRGFAWFFAHSRPQGNCAGREVVATWYAIAGRTANGETFSSERHTAAHRTLPFGSLVTVTNPRNGKAVTVTINDRGPFTHGVTLDLARGAARAIGMTGTQWVCMS